MNTRDATVSLMRSLVRDAVHVYGRRVALLVVLTLVGALLEGTTIALLLPLFGTLGFGASDRAGGLLTRAVVATFAMVGLPFTPVSVGSLLLGLLVVSAAVFLLQSYHSTRLRAKFVAHWQRQLFQALTASRWSFLRLRRSGDIAAALTSEAARLERAFYLTELTLSTAITVVTQVAVAAVLAPSVTLVILIVGLSLFLITQPLIHRAVSVGNALTHANSNLLTRAGELTSAMKLIKATATEREAGRLIEQPIARIEHLNFVHAFDVQIVRAAFEYLSAAAIALLLICGPLLLGFEISAIIVVVAMFVRLFPRLTALRHSLQTVALALPAYGRMREIYNQATAEREEVIASEPRSGPAAIRIKGVSVHGDDATAILDGVDIEIPAGSFTAIVGTSGAGKSTLVDCVLGLVQPHQGEVQIDGVPLRGSSLSLWRHGIGYLGQEPVLFAGTIRENVTWGRAEIDDATVTAALKAAGAEFAIQRSGGIDAVVAERGGSLSGGERQRIALARAFSRASRLLILDEATSAVDSETEAAVASAIFKLRGRTTVLAVSHRLAAIRDADQIIVLESGRVVECGKFESLIARNGRFSMLWHHNPPAAA